MVGCEHSSRSDGATIQRHLEHGIAPKARRRCRPTACSITCKHVLPHMLQRRSGAIVNVSSVAAIRYTGYPYVAYYAAKAAVNNFTMGLALQYAKDGIRLTNAVTPRADEYTPDLSADFRPVRKRRGDGEGSRDGGLPDGAHVNLCSFGEPSQDPSCQQM